MSVIIRSEHLRQEMARRGWDGIDLARESRLSAATVSAALGGRPIAAKSLVLIARALAQAPVIDAIDALLAEPPSRDLG